MQDGLESPRRQWALATVVIGIGLAVIDSSVANVALPAIAEDFGVSPASSIWIVNGYQMALVVSLLPLAALGEIYGLRRVYTIGLAVFTLASLACALAPSLPMLTLARIAQGFGAAGLMSINTAVIRYIVPKARLGSAIGMNAMVVAVASTVGPTFAGFVLHWASWPWLFAVNVPFGVLAVVLAAKALPDSDRSTRRFDVTAALLSAAMFGLLITSVDSVGHGVDGRLVAVQIMLGLVAAVLLVRRELPNPLPLLPLDLLAKPIFALSIGTSIASFAAHMMASVALPFLLFSRFDFPPVTVGLLMAPWPIAVAVAAPVAGRLSDRYAPGLLGGIGLAMLACGLVALGLLQPQPDVADIVWRMALCGAGFGLFQSPNNRTMIGAAPKARSGAASGMLSTARLTGQAIGTAIVGLLLAQLGMDGAEMALFVAAGAAVLGALVSLLRLGHPGTGLSREETVDSDLAGVPAPNPEAAR